ncbi:MAG TPA: PD-(D/E)XK nuclease family protein [Pseudolysinimonas sp.]|nr:PD-(D/E)XK nuclease family protein [Pseudolysinimonas sp.]
MTDPLLLDASQRAVLGLPVGQTAVVVGAPGSGKTTTLVEFAADRVEHHGLAPDELLIIAADRHSATVLRDRVAVRLGVVTSGPLARTAAAVAFEAVTARALAEMVPAPALLSGADHDTIIRELLIGDHERGDRLAWPEHLDWPVRSLRVFRTELRELMMRATEHGLEADDLRRLAGPARRPEWHAAATFIEQYRQVIASVRSDRLDPAELLAFAEAAVDDGLQGERLRGVRLILVDDLQQITEGTVRLLAAFVRSGAAVVAFGDPDVATNGFRGGEADIFGRLGARLGVSAQRVVLETVHRHGPELRAVTQTVTGHIGTAGQGMQRAASAHLSRADVVGDGSESAATASGVAEPIRSISGASASAVNRAIARQLRERHLLEGVPWSQLAIIVHSSSAIPDIVRSMAAAQVPTRTLMGGQAVRDQAAAAALLRIVEVAIARVELDGASAGELLVGPFGALDSVGLRRLRRELRAEELDGGGTRTADALLVEALGDPARFATIDHAVGRAARKLATLLAAVRESHAAGGSAEEVLWAAWEGAGVAEAWRRQALGGGIAADEANRALDGIVALFTAARRYVERMPTGTADAFLSEVLDAEVPEDTLAPQADADSVLVVTPSGASGREFDTVVVTGLQEGQWPNVRPRGSLLGAPDLVAATAGRLDASIDSRREVLADELRTLALAVSRPRSRLIIAAIDSDDETPSSFFSLLGRTATPAVSDAPQLTLRGLTGRLRRVLTSARAERELDSAAAALAAFADADVAGAAPRTWRGMIPVSTEAPLWDLDDPEVRVPVSPSKLDEVERSPMEWFVSAMAGGGSGLSANVGTLVHDVLEHAESSDADELWAALESRWGELAFESEWQAEIQRVAARRAIEALAAYLTHFVRDGAVLVSAEGEFRLDLAPAVLTGKIDRVESRDSGIVIVDLKTGSVKSAQDAVDHPQLGAYQVAYADGAIDNLPDGHQPGGAALLFTKKGSGRGAAKVPYTVLHQEAFDAERLEQFRSRVRAAAQRMVGPVLEAAVIDDPWAYGGEIRRVHLPGEVSGD